MHPHYGPDARADDALEDPARPRDRAGDGRPAVPAPETTGCYALSDGGRGVHVSHSWRDMAAAARGRHYHPPLTELLIL
jgi:hypothetical protein